MFMSILSGLVVSVDAFFIGISLGMQKRCRFLHLMFINIVLAVMCLVGFLVAGEIHELIDFEPDLIVGITFIAIGLWTIGNYFISFYFNKRQEAESDERADEGTGKIVVLVGSIMSFEAMVITIGLTFIFQPYATLVIPITVALAHFAYSAATFFLARTKHVQRFPVTLCHVISGLALIAYGLMALFVEIGV